MPAFRQDSNRQNRPPIGPVLTCCRRARKIFCTVHAPPPHRTLVVVATYQLPISSLEASSIVFGGEEERFNAPRGPDRRAPSTNCSSASPIPPPPCGPLFPLLERRAVLWGVWRGPFCGPRASASLSTAQACTATYRASTALSFGLGLGQMWLLPVYELQFRPSHVLGERRDKIFWGVACLGSIFFLGQLYT